MAFPSISWPGWRRVLPASVALAVVVGGAVSAQATPRGTTAGHARRVQPLGSPATGSQPNVEFRTTANPTSLDPPVPVPPTRPVVVPLLTRQQFGNAPPPAVVTVSLPHGRWSTVVLDVVGREKGRQYDRTMTVFDGSNQIFLGTTPEPTEAGIRWHVRKDVTGYLPVLRGRRTFTITLANYLDTIHTGIPVMSVSLEFYRPGGGFAPARPASLAAPALAGDATTLTGVASPPRHPRIPDAVVPVVPTPTSTGMTAVGTSPSNTTYTAPVSLPRDVTTATLDLYLEHQSTDEFFYGLSPAFREADIAVDGRPAGVVWPYPVIYTGGVNPLLWRPLTAIHTLQFPSYRLDLTPFAGTLHGKHTITVTIVGNLGYWNVSANLLLTQNGGVPTTGRVTTDTLTFPGTSRIARQNVFGETDKAVLVETANRRYEIRGTIRAANGSWADDLSQRLQYANDQSNLGTTTQYLHLEQVLATGERITGTGTHGISRSSRASYTTDVPESFLQTADGSAFFLPAQVSQQLAEVDRQTGGVVGGRYATSLQESLEGYAALEEDNSAFTIADGSTTGMVDFTDSAGRSYRRTVVTHGGVVEQNLVSGG